eukprot:TRINITY_DN9325_c0_g1_i1.p1 TRINITY_DN9325_c0_g1~~TRINITY_DN9325_c0_g1_i1.p1  ORF type:complete len:421 (+),score=79.61 TRINITY_DN9325_c0_g1_i1:52-1314(+)
MLRRLFTPKYSKSHEVFFFKRLYATNQGYSSRTEITTKLWEKRRQIEQEQNKTIAEEEIGIEAPSYLLNKKPKDSRVEISYPFRTNHVLREQYINYFGGIRFGKLLEDLDACAGNIAFNHANDNNPRTRPLSIVTASVDRIDLLNKLLADRNLLMEGALSYVGKSSMEVRINVHSQDPTTEQYDPLILATFTMVATFDGKPALVNHLTPETEQEQMLFKMGEDNKRRKSEHRKHDLKFKPPTPEESVTIHNLFLETTHPDRSTPILKMSDAQLQTVRICEPQERNIHNTVFGGFLLRSAYDLAWATAQTYCAETPYFLSLDEVNFLKPVKIGDLLIFDSRIVYNEGHSLTVQVVAQVLHTTTKKKETTDTFYFTFTVAAGIPTVVPTTYEEVVNFLKGRRSYKNGLEVAKSLDSSLLRFY